MQPKSFVSDKPERIKSYWIAAAWVIVLALTAFVYWPGLVGPFLFDDFGSLSELGKYGGVRDWDTFKAFVFGGNAGPTGRPLALFTFLLDANNWPADAWPFKRTNLIIHLLNGVLLGVVVRQLLTALRFESNDVHRIALVAAACWMLHPFLVSTTLYVVQRMAQLATMFILIGIIGYLHGRTRITSNACKAYLVMTVAVIACTLLALLSKENGVLLPLLIAVIEFTVLASLGDQIGRLDRRWVLVFIGIPIAAVVLYLSRAVWLADFFSVRPPREYSLYERVLTQPRILLDYLQHWFVPKLFTTGVFQDHFVKSTGLLAPITTMLSLVVHAAFVGIAVVKRRDWPLLSLSILFFYGSHVLESTVINLELYFEHRNYLAVAFLYLPLIVWLRRSLSARLFGVLVLSVLVLLGGFTRYSSHLWSDYSGMVEAVARKAPYSARAQGQFATILFNQGRFAEAQDVLNDAVQLRPENAELRVSQLVILCSMNSLSGQYFRESASMLAGRPLDGRHRTLYETLNSVVIGGKCPEVTIPLLRDMYGRFALVTEGRTKVSAAQTFYFLGYVELVAGNQGRAVSAFEKSLGFEPAAEQAMMMAAVLAMNGAFRDALRFSEYALSDLDSRDPGLLDTVVVSRRDVLEFQENVNRELSDFPGGQPTDDNSDPIQ